MGEREGGGMGGIEERDIMGKDSKKERQRRQRKIEQNRL